MENFDRIPALLEQYKIFVEMADRVSERRLKTNQFYIGLISGLLGVLAFILEGIITIDILTEHKNSAVVLVSLLGIALNFVWFVTIRSFRRLNSGKFQVIHQMETLLPFDPYFREWIIIREGDKKDKYLQLTKVERFLPIILTSPFLILLILKVF